MPKFNAIKNNFSIGELSPRLFGRSDTPTFQNAGATIENYVILLGGGLCSRCGTQFIAETKDSTKESRLLPFVASALSSYVLEFGHNYIRVYTNGEQIMDGDDPYEITTTYTESDIANIDYCQEGNTMYLVHPDHAPATLVWTSDTSWSLTTISFTSTPASWTGSNYPKSVTLYQQRLVFGGTNDKPQTIWGTKSGSRTDLTLGSLDDDAYSFTIATDTVAPILYLTSGKTIVAHTYLNEFTIAGSSDNPLTPSNVSIEQRSSFGCSFVKPEKIGNLTVFVQRAGTRVRAFQYSFAEDAYDAPDTAAFAEHITSVGVKEITYSQEPNSTLLCVLDNGQMGVLSIDLKQGLQGWSRFVTTGTYESVTNIPIVGEDQTWVIVNRDDKRYVEMFVRGTNTDFHMIQSSETLETVWSGFDHLEGLTVDIIADGSPQPQQTVTDGTITLARGAYDVEVGLEYDSTLVDLPVEVAGSGVGQTAQGSHMSCNEVVVRFYNTKTAVINGNVQTFRRFGESVLDQPIAFFTGDLDVHLIQGWSDRGQISIQRVDPLQQIIVGIYKKVSIND